LKSVKIEKLNFKKIKYNFLLQMSLDYLDYKNYLPLKFYLITDIINIVFEYTELMYYNEKATQKLIDHISSIPREVNFSTTDLDKNLHNINYNILKFICKIYICINITGDMTEFIYKLSTKKNNYVFLSTFEYEDYYSNGAGGPFHANIDYYIRDSIAELLNILKLNNYNIIEKLKELNFIK
jgi:hypothetical protein